MHKIISPSSQYVCEAVLSSHTVFVQDTAEFDACDEVAYDHLQRQAAMFHRQSNPQTSRFSITIKIKTPYERNMKPVVF